MTGAGYREVVDYLRGKTTLTEATEEVKRSHRRYARRQATWFRHQLPEGILVLDPSEPSEILVAEIVQGWFSWTEENDG